jgi:hypothetical protein
MNILLHSSDSGKTDEIIETSNPGVVGRVAGRFRSPRTGQMITVMSKEGESNAHALARVKARHGA